MIKILFVCHGNICRSPMCEFVMKKLVSDAGLSEQFHIASAATTSEEIHGPVGNPVYPPARKKLAEHGIRCDGKRASLMTPEDYGRYDYLVGMDEENREDMFKISGGDPEKKISLLLDDTEDRRSIADPWYTGDFERTWQDVLKGCKALFARCVGRERGKSLKKALRKEMLSKAESLPDAYCRQADEAIFREIRSMPEYAAARTVFCYVGTEREIQTRPFLERILEDGKRLAVPRCTGKGVMKALQLEGLSELKPGTMGIPEPPESCPEMMPEEIDLALIPCVSCTPGGARIGYGGGFYDRYLRKSGAFRACLIRAHLLSEEIPTEEHDMRMDAVITENGRIDCQTAGDREANRIGGEDGNQI